MVGKCLIATDNKIIGTVSLPSTFTIKRNTNIRSEVSENRDVIFFSAKFTGSPELHGPKDKNPEQGIETLES